jgi:pimeloyl-ACP methyl ester carboxylesterase
MERRQFFGVAGALAAGAMIGRALAATGDVPKRTDAAAWRAARRMAKTSFGNIAYVERGRGEAVLFLYGFPLNGFQWRGAFDRLARGRRCIAPDFLGLGYTEVAPGGSVAPDAQVAMIVALLDALGVARVDLVANDSGGAVAQLFITRHRKRVRTLLLTNCDTEPDSPPPAMQPVLEMARAGTFADAWLAKWVADKKLARSAEGIGGMTYTYRAHPSDEAIDTYLAPLVASPERKTLVHAYALGLDPNPLAGIEAALRKCTVPTRIVWGTGDDIFRLESAAYLDRTLPESRGVRYLEDAKLFWPEEFPDVVAEEARGLWRGG